MEQNPILTNQLSLNSDIPLYSQLVGIIKRSISSGTLNVGDLLPSEAELCRALDVSRNTVRQAIGELEEEGLVVRKRGKGTFVADPNTNRRGVRYSFTTEISSLGKVPSSTLVDFAVITPSREVCEKMDLHEGTSVYCFTRVRNVDGEPLILETSYYPKYIYPNLTRELVQTHSFYSLLYHVGITPFSRQMSRMRPSSSMPPRAPAGRGGGEQRVLSPAPHQDRGRADLRVHLQLYPRRPRAAGCTHAEERHELHAYN